VIIGYGSVGPLHCAKLRKSGVTVIAVDVDAQRQAQALADGIDPFSSIEDAAARRPDFWDVCVGTPEHLGVIERIVALAPDTCIIVEKPLCLHRQIDDLMRVLRRFRGKICINENYYGSRITQIVRRVALLHLKLDIHRVVVEMTKNRQRDFGRGRFVDPEGGAIKYEGSHMLAVLQDLGKRFLIDEILNASSTNAVVATPNGPRVLEHQGGAALQCRTADGVEVLLHTSMIGEVRHPYPPRFIERIPPDSEVRYRVLAVHGRDSRDREVAVVGFYEPIEGLHRGHGAVSVIRDGAVQRMIAPMADDHLSAHLGSCIDYFCGLRDNPSPVPQAVDATRLLHMLGRAATTPAPCAADPMPREPGEARVTIG